MSSTSSCRKRAQDLVDANLVELAADLLHWRRKGRLPEGSKLAEVAKVLDEEDHSDTSMQQAEYLVVLASLERVAVPAQQGSDSVASAVNRLDWASRSLRVTANRGRAQLGDGYTEVLQVLGAVNASLEVLGATPPN